MLCASEPNVIFIPTLSLEITLILLLQDCQSIFRDFSERIYCLKMTDIRNILEVTFPDDGVSVLYMLCVVYFSFLFFYFYFYF